MNMPRVTVLIANHNYDQYLMDAINSAIKQTYPILQICIIDDLSTDNSWDVIEKFIKSKDCKQGKINNQIDILMSIENNRKYTALKLNQNSGPSLARNIGIEVTLSDTDIYAILDADDIMYPNKIEKCVEKLMQYPDVGVVYADYDILNVHTNNLIREYKEPFSQHRLLQECIVHSGSLIKKEALQAAKDQFGYYDVNMRTCEDYDLWIRISEKYSIAHIPEALTLVRNHKNNSTHSVHNDIWKQNWARIGQKISMRQQRKL